jgi:hypothetical protein
MANLYWNNEKTDSDEAVKLMKEHMVDLTESRFFVRQEGDDSGSYLCVYVERDEEGNKTSQRLPDKFEGWRTVLVYTPHEFIKYVMESRKE